ncbi:MAG: nitrous oxide-stimulated promoter family protein [Clostridia bacterium]
MSKKTENKRENEKNLIELMIKIYCNSKHKTKNSLCEQCQEILEYSHLRINKCPFMETKSFCSNCKVHCFKRDKREKIREIMAFSGKRMIFYHPILAIKHLIQTKNKEKIGESNVKKT